MLHMVIALAGHEIDSIPKVYFNDREVNIESDGRVSSSPYQVTTPPTEIRAGVIFTSRVSNIVTMTTDVPHQLAPGDVARITNNGFPAASPIGNDYTILTTPSATTLTFANTGVDYSTNVTGLVKHTKSTTSSYAYVHKYLGSPDQAASAQAQANIPGWSGDHRLRNIAYLYVRLEFNNDVFPLGIPNISAVVKGKKVYDPRTGLTAWSDNAAPLHPRLHGQRLRLLLRQRRNQRHLFHQRGQRLRRERDPHHRRNPEAIHLQRHSRHRFNAARQPRLGHHQLGRGRDLRPGQVPAPRRGV